MAVIRSIVNDLKCVRTTNELQRKNAELNKNEALQEKVFLHSYPRRIFLEMTSACNINCKMCGRNAAEFKPTFLNYEWLDVLNPIVRYAEELTLMGWGEPTMHPRFPDFLKWGFERDLSIYFCTNGTMLGKLKDDIFNYHVDIITVSLDGANATTNNEIRCGADFDTIIRYITEIQEKKEVLDVEYPFLSIVITLMKSNYRELPDFVRLAHKMGITEVKGVFLTVFESRMMDESLYKCQDDVVKVFKEATLIGDELGVDLKLPYMIGEDPAEEGFHKKCHMAWRDFYIGSDGYVRPCMHTSHKLFRIDQYSSFEEMWNSKEYQEFRASVNNEKMDDNCKNCYHATYGNWNREECYIQIGNNFSPEWEK